MSIRVENIIVFKNSLRVTLQFVEYFHFTPKANSADRQGTVPEGKRPLYCLLKTVSTYKYQVLTIVDNR